MIIISSMIDSLDYYCLISDCLVFDCLVSDCLVYYCIVYYYLFHDCLVYYRLFYHCLVHDCLVRNCHVYDCVWLLQMSYVLLQFDYFVCPIVYDETKDALSMDCERTFVFRLHEYMLPQFLQNFGLLVKPHSQILLSVFQGSYFNRSEFYQL